MIQDALNRIENGVVELQMIVLHIEVENGVGTRLRPENKLIGPLASSQDVAFTADQCTSVPLPPYATAWPADPSSALFPLSPHKMVFEPAL
ncbi:hypothetical protein ABIF50_010132 [Bradyrhizobium diazoefficiens]